jgi:N-acyl-D-amino-acid deacylase
LLGFDPGLVRARATFEEPHRLASGFDFVLVNGRVAVERGVLIPWRFGWVLGR